jgi:hypothetical protein
MEKVPRLFSDWKRESLPEKIAPRAMASWQLERETKRERERERERERQREREREKERERKREREGGWMEPDGRYLLFLLNFFLR